MLKIRHPNMRAGSCFGTMTAEAIPGAGPHPPRSCSGGEFDAALAAINRRLRP